ncbi:aspartate dehydrogenase [SAR202 cluster bacterium AD-804-J14_MRT_500m]|nr:aspartate dehydrogenase [SAR202 cluster bacterium AD-804-J14_MRT_500m]
MKNELKKIGIGIIGCGSIGGDIARVINAGDISNAALVALFDQDETRGKSLESRLHKGVRYFSDIDHFLSNNKLDLIIECASPIAVRDFGEKILSSNKHLVVMSTGALLDGTFFQNLTHIAGLYGKELLIPSGAIGGLDAIRSVAHQLEEVTLTTTKPPSGLSGSLGFKDWEDTEINSKVIIYQGSAMEAVKLFPANVNVAASLSLAGLGAMETKVKVIADPQASSNTHEIVAKGEFGTFRLTFENQPHPKNPRTSYLSVLSAIELLNSFCGSSPKIGT